MKNQGTLIGAPITINDSEDLYPSAFQREIKGGHHKRTLFVELATFPAHLKEAGMTCYVSENKNTYQLADDLTTWNLHVSASSGSGGGTVDPGTGGNSSSATIISGNFGEWTNILAKSASIFDEQLAIQFKTDLSAFPTRAITYLTGQFGLASAFDGTEITLGTLPASNRPKSKIKKWIACRGVELYLVVETTGAIKLLSKDGFKLPVATAGTENDPYHIDVFFNPNIATVEPTIYTYTRKATFIKNNCGAGENGTEVEFSKQYASILSMEDAQNMAMADPNFENLGQAKANADGTCETEELENNTVYITPTYPTPQVGMYNVFGFKFESERPLNEYITVHFEARYEGVGGGAGEAKYTNIITLPPNSTDFDPGGYPVLASPAAQEPTITILSVTPSDGMLVTEYGTTNKFKLAVPQYG